MPEVVYFHIQLDVEFLIIEFINFSIPRPVLPDVQTMSSFHTSK